MSSTASHREPADDCLGLDIGSTSIKGAVLDLALGEVRAITQEPFPAPLPNLPPGHFEVDPQAVVIGTQQVLARLIQVAPAAQALFCSGQMGGTILVDQRGTALTNYLSWRDQRALPLLDTIRGLWTDGELTQLGNELQPGSASSLLFWLTEHNQLPADATPATIADFVLGQLCHAPPQMDRTHAIGLLDLRSGDWHRAAFEKLGLGSVQWPQLADARTPIGHLFLAGRILACHAAFGDQQCALRGIDLTRDELSLNISTGSQVSRRTATWQPGEYQSRRYFNGDFLNTITHLPAGRSLNVMCNLLTELAQAEGITLKNVWQTIAERAAESDGGGLDVDLCYFAGPLGSVGHIQRITTENLTIGNWFRAAFASMAENYDRCADRLCAERSGLRIALSGGLTRSVPTLRQLIEDKFGLPVREPAATEETLLGLLKVARDVYGTD